MTERQRNRYDKRIAARIIVDAKTMGHEAAAELWNVSTKTIQRYIARLESGSDPALSTEVSLAGQKQDRIVAVKRRRSLAIVEEKMVELVQKATPAELGDVVRAFEALRDGEIAAKVLNVGAGPDPEDPGAAADAGGPGEGEDGGDPTSPH